MERHPRDNRDQEHLHDKHPIDIAHIEVLGQERYRENVDEEREDRGGQDAPVQLVDARVDVEQLGEDQRRERDGNDVCERLVEEHDRPQHDHAALGYAHKRGQSGGQTKRDLPGRQT